MEYEVTMCIDCNEDARMSDQTFLCKTCFDNYVQNLRSKYGTLNKNSVKHPDYEKWLKVALENDVTEYMYKNRVYSQGMSYKEAAEMGRLRKRKVVGK